MYLHYSDHIQSGVFNVSKEAKGDTMRKHRQQYRYWNGVISTEMESLLPQKLVTYYFTQCNSLYIVTYYFVIYYYFSEDKQNQHKNQQGIKIIVTMANQVQHINQ